MFTQEELQDLFYAKDETLDEIKIVNEDCIQAKLVRRKTSRKTNKQTNVVITAYVTSYCRIMMDVTMRNLQQAGAHIYYTDCDAVYFSYKKSSQDFPLSQAGIVLGECPGNFKFEYKNKEIEAFFALGPKNLALLCREIDGSVRMETKVSGLSLTNYAAKNSINIETFRHFVDKAIRKENVSQKIFQIRRKRCATTKPAKSHIVKFTYTNKFNNRRVLNNKHTYPFGFSKNMPKLS